jgi:hypothetical protein
VKRVFLVLTLICGLTLSAIPQSTPPIRLQEVDGTPKVLGPTTIKVTNGSLSCTGKVCTITIGAGSVTGPGSATDNAVARFDGTSGAVLQNSNWLLSDAGAMDVTTMTAPSNPASGFQRIYANSSTGKFACLDSSGANCFPSGVAIGDTVTSGTANSILFVNSGPILAQDNGNLYWDDTNNRMCIGCATCIGCTALSNPLRVTGASIGGHSMNLNSGSSAGFGDIVIGDHNNSSIGLIGYAGNSTGVFYADNLYLGTTASKEVVFFTNSTEAHRITTTQNQFSFPVVPKTNALTDLGTTSLGWRQLLIDQTITAGGTTGNQTINKAAGTVNIAAAGTSVTVTSNKCTTSSLVFAVIRTNDSTATIKNVVPGSGSFVITLGAAATGEVSIGWWILNQ